MAQAEKPVQPHSQTDRDVRPVLILSDSFWRNCRGYVEHLLYGLADESVRLGLVFADGGYGIAGEWPSVEVFEYPAFNIPFAEHFNANLLVDQISQFRPTVLHCVCESKSRFANRLARKLNLPYILNINGIQHRRDRLDISSKRCARLLVPAASVGRSVISFYPKFSDRVEQTTVGTFVDEAKRCFEDLSKTPSIVTDTGLKASAHYEKLLGAIKRLVLDSYDFVMVIMCTPQAEHRLYRRLNSLGLSQRVLTVSAVEHFRQLLGAADVFVRSQPDEKFSCFVLEAVAAGAAVAGCRGGVDDLIIQDTTAIVFDGDDELSIYDKLKQLLNRPEHARKLARSAQQYLGDRYTVSKMIAEILNIYRRAQGFLKSHSAGATTGRTQPKSLGE